LSKKTMTIHSNLLLQAQGVKKTNKLFINPLALQSTTSFVISKYKKSSKMYKAGNENRYRCVLQGRYTPCGGALQINQFLTSSSGIGHIGGLITA
jgi:hypothetical protein